MCSMRSAGDNSDAARRRCPKTGSITTVSSAVTRRSELDVQKSRRRRTVPVAGRLAVNVMSLAIAAAVAGLGIAQVPEGLAMPDVRAGRLAQVLDPFVVDRTRLYLVFQS